MSWILTGAATELPRLNGIYRHYKGGTYHVIAVAKHTETKELLVVYRSLKYGSIWCRPLAIWNEKVGRKKRFTEIKIT